MYAEDLSAPLLAALDRPDLRVVGQAQRITFDASLDTEFRADPDGAVVLGAACLGSERLCAFHIRHALELSMLLNGLPDGVLHPSQDADPLDQPGKAILAGLCAARTAALFWELDGPGADPADGAVPSWLQAMGAESVPDAETLALVWARVRHLQGAAFRLLAEEPAGAISGELPGSVIGRLQQIWGLLGPAEALMARGGDQRLAVDPRTGLNHYGCSHRPRPWAITFASSTASSLSERGFGGAEASRRRLAADAVRGEAPQGLRREARSVREGIASHYGIDSGCEVLLAASGTDCELLALALAERADPDRAQPVSSILTAPEETGTGVPLSAGGRHFADDTSQNQQVSRGAAIPGFRTDTRVLPLAVRHPDGTVRTAMEIEQECAALVAAERAAGRRVLLHLLDLSKTGLLAPSLGCLERLCALHGDGLDIVVDGCQARLDRRRVRDYLARGWMVMITGSKFFTGPPFCGAVLLPAAVAARLGGARSLPAGLAAYCSRSDWPDWVKGARHLPEDINLGMVMRWQAALAEMQAFGAVPAAQVRKRLAFFLAGVREAIAINPQVVMIEVAAPERALVPASEGPPAESGWQAEQSWDQLQTILSFLVLDPATGAPLSLDRARLLYRALNADVADLLPPQASEADRALGRLLCHIGQPAPVMHQALAGKPAGALRISAGARLLSGEPSHEGLDAARRLAREVADARRVLDKITLLLRHWTILQDAEPEPTYAPRS